MRCPSCNSENPEGSLFCGECGSKLPVLCPQCGAEVAPDVKFCRQCGTRLGGPTQPEQPGTAAARALRRVVPRGFADRLLATRGQTIRERRIVTVLFSDVKDSTPMAERFDPEEYIEIMDGALEVLIEPITRYEGALAHMMGDGILAFFGAPIAHEDDAERASRAALDIIEGARNYAARLEVERGISGFAVRVGIHTGLVVVGEVGSDLRVEYTAMGDTVNLASRMEEAAEPGTVLITEDTYRLIAPLFETEALGRMEVRGKELPVLVHRVLAPRVVTAKPRGIEGLESPLVGREAEFAALRGALERLQAGVGGIVTIVGEAGIGKSRLVAELRNTAVSLDLAWVEGRCLSYGTSMAYVLWLDVLRSVLGLSVEDPLPIVHDALQRLVRTLCPDRLDDVYPYLARLMSLPLAEEDEAGIQDLEAKDLKIGTFRAAEILVECAAGQEPLVIVCEDLQWADPTSLELLERLLALTDATSLLLICVFRPETEHASWHIRETAARLYHHRHTDLRLSPLSAGDSGTLLDNLLRVGGLPQDLEDHILGHADGNPFYVEEIIRSLIDSAAIVQDEATGRWEATRAVSDIAIPDTLQGVLMARIDRLQEETKRVLQMASVIGRIFLYRVLVAIAREELELNRRLVTLQREEMIRERARVPELEYIFKHHLTQEAAYNGLLRRERSAFHRQVAETLEQLFPGRVEEQVGLLAHHWERAGDADRAMEYLLRAGDQARVAYAHEEAIDYYRRALVLLKEGGEHERAARTLMKLGLTYHTAFSFEEGRRAFEQGFVLWQQAASMEPIVPLRPAPHALRTHGEDPETLDPGLAETLVSTDLIRQLFSGLVGLTPDMGVVPDVARTWEALDGGRRYLFHLRGDVRWSDGVPVTADDFEYAWKRALQPTTGSTVADLLYDVKGARPFHQGRVSDPDSVGVRALDESTLAVELEGPTGYFLHLAASCVTCPVPRHIVEAQGRHWTDVGNIVTNGPFKLETWHPGEFVGLSRHRGYHGRFGGNVQRIEITLLPVSELASALRMYEADELDTLNLTRLLPAKIDPARLRHAGEYVRTPRLSTCYIGFDVRQPPFDDVRVRRAFVLATDREALADVVLRGYESPATGGFLPPGMPGYSPGIGLPYNPDEARRLLAEAGYPGGRGFASVEAVASYVHLPHIGYVEAQWRENLDVDISWDLVEALTGNRLLSEPPHMFAMWWLADYPDPDNFLRTSTIPWCIGWGNEVCERLIEEARRVPDQAERMRLYGQAERILLDEARIMPLTHVPSHRLVKPWVRRYAISAIDTYFWKDVIIEPH